MLIDVCSRQTRNMLKRANPNGAYRPYANYDLDPEQRAVVRRLYRRMFGFDPGAARRAAWQLATIYEDRSWARR